MRLVGSGWSRCCTAHGLGRSLALGLPDEIIDLRRQEGRFCGHLRRRPGHASISDESGSSRPSQALDSAQEGGNPADASANVRYPKRLGLAPRLRPAFDPTIVKRLHDPFAHPIPQIQEVEMLPCSASAFGDAVLFVISPTARNRVGGPGGPGMPDFSG